MKRYFIIFVTILTISCGESETKFSYENASIEFADDHFKFTDSLRAQVIEHISDSIFRSATLKINNDYLFLNEITSDKSLHAIKIPEDVYLGKFGNKGGGPGEIVIPWKIFNSDEETLVVLDTEQRKIVEYNVDTLLLKNTYQRELKLGLGVLANGVSINDNKMYFTDGNNLNNRLYSTDIDGTNLVSYGKLPEVRSTYSNLPEGELMESIGLTKLVNNRGIFALSYYNIPLIDIFNLEKNDWISITGPDHFPSQQSLSKTLYYGSISISDKYIYALYFGTEDYMNENSKTIYVFSHTGELIKKLNLDKGIFEFDVFKDEIIYGITNNNQDFGYAVLKFKL